MNLRFWGEAFKGTNTATLTLTLVGLNEDGSTFEAINIANPTFSIFVASCGTTVFGDLEVTANVDNLVKDSIVVV
jgi:hypothetical protein